MIKICDRLHNREHRGNVGRYMAGRGGDSGWRLYVVTIHALEMLLPAVCERRSEDTYDQVLLASCEVGLLKDWSNRKQMSVQEGEGLFVLCLAGGNLSTGGEQEEAGLEQREQERERKRERKREKKERERKRETKKAKKAKKAKKKKRKKKEGEKKR